MKSTPIVVLIIIGASLIGAVVFALFAAQKIAPKDFWKETSIACYKDLTVTPSVTLTATLEMTVDGTPEIIGGGVGLTPTCIAEIHTGSEPGTIEAFSADPNRTFTLGDFFAVWGRSIERDGYALAATVGSTSTPEIANHILKDGDKITLTYTKAN